ncbi:related to phosphoribosyl-5-aminoimidazole carboxylase [Claviceps purpurea 20.1]|uniref:Phosphoribosylaminoimidazole carboxylase n=1 Tax=Claviceps purpurea (strain 20.1) TaxID=1111077 RepID=M1W582_CLAP2|nr:related to phosphoribosyl-5-aminoimidazole carboxylase [Claviceps purpurea 20.1]
MSSKTPVVGLLGGGQLGRMLCEAGAPLNAQIVILDAEKCPAKQINSNENHVTGSFKDAAKIRELASHCDVMTVEIEHIDTEVLEEIDTQGVSVRHADGTTSRKKVAVHPSWRTLRLVQNKYEQKEYLSRRGVPVAAQMAIESGDAMRESMEAASAKFGYPWMLKARTDSYDGRGNFKVSSWADLEQAHREFGHLSCYAEKWVPFELELAVMVVRTEDDAGQLKRVVPYPVVETVHEDNICSKVFMPPRGVSAEVCEKAQKVAMSVVEHLWGRGVFAVEMFLTREGDITFNECAPRPHNSGHASIESIPYMSQFKAQLAAILDEPLPEVLEPHVSSSIMINILGGASPDSHLALVEKAKSMYGNKTAVYVHLYGKDSKPSRKIGHITVTGFGPIAELETFAKPLLQMTDSIRHERLQSSSASLRPQAAVPAASPAAAATTKTKRPQGTPLVLVTMGSDSDLPVLKAGIDILNQFGVPWEVDITSAHRTPDKMAQRAREAADRGLKVIIAAAGGAAHLPGMLAAYTPLPVIGVPVKATHLDGYDSLLSIVQMPRGVPTATVAINNSTNAALLAIRFLGAFMPELLQKMKDYQLDMEQQVKEKAETLREIDVDAYLEKMGKK